MRGKRKVHLLPQLVESIVGDKADVFILFADLCNSSEYKKNCIDLNQPDVNWIFRQLFFLQRAAEIVKKNNGQVVKTIGDEILAVFAGTTNAENVLKCAIEIIQSFSNVKAYQGQSKIEAKTSIDFGVAYNGSIVNSVVFDPIGLPVDRCARLNSLAKNNEVVFSEDFLALALANYSPGDFQKKYGYQTQLENLKGFGITKIHRIDASYKQ